MASGGSGSTTTKKTVLFYALNSPGHINCCLGIAGALKRNYNLRTVFLVVGPVQGTSVVDQGHELVVLDEVRVHEDYEISDDEDPSAPVDEELMRAKGKSKRKFPGHSRGPQMVQRIQHLIRLDPLEAFTKIIGFMTREMIGEMAENYENLEAAIKSVAPDLIVVDSYFVPPCVVKQSQQVPWVKLYSANPMMLARSRVPGVPKVPATLGLKLYSKREREQMRNNEPDRWQSIVDEWKVIGQKMMQAMVPAQGDPNSDPLGDFYRKHECPPPPPGQQSHESPHLNIYMYPEQLDYDQDDDLFEYSERMFRCDSLMRNQFQQDEKYTAQMADWDRRIDQALGARREIVFFSLGTLASGNVKLMKRIIDILKDDIERLYLVSKGINGDRYQLNEANMLGANYVPQAHFLKRANLAIVHGGNNSITECMFYGLPTIVMPLFFDQVDNAQRLEDLKLGRRLNVFDCTREDLLGAINELLADQDLIERVRNVGLKMRATEDSKKVGFLLNKLIQDKRLDQQLIDECRASP